MRGIEEKETSQMVDATPWAPAVRLDLAMATQTALKKSVEGFLEWRKGKPVPSLMLSDGWHVVTPQMAEQFLILNDQNRKLRVQEVLKIARQMLAGNWKKTGQTIVFNDKGRLNEGQHRCWACYLCGAPFETFIVTNASSEPNIFAYYDRGAPRGLKDVLETAHHDGFAAVVAGVVNLVHHHFTAGDTKTSVSKILPEELLEYVEANPEIEEVVQDQLMNYKAATDFFGKHLAVYIAWLIFQQWGDGYQDFMDDFGSQTAPSDTPIGMLHEKLADFRRARAEHHKPIPRTHVIAFTILAFNAWKTGAKLKTLRFPTRGPWPTIVARSAMETAAE